MKMGRRLRCSWVTYGFRYAPSSRPAAAGPAAHFDRNESHAIYGTGHWIGGQTAPITSPSSILTAMMIGRRLGHLKQPNPEQLRLHDRDARSEREKPAHIPIPVPSFDREDDVTFIGLFLNDL